MSSVSFFTHVLLLLRLLWLVLLLLSVDRSDADGLFKIPTTDFDFDRYLNYSIQQFYNRSFLATAKPDFQVSFSNLRQ